MKAIVQDGYGSPDALKLREVDSPIVGDGEVLVRVRAASVHPDVWHAVTGLPYAVRLIGAGFRRPTNPIPGTDLAGRVESVGTKVTRFKTGDDVFGECVRGQTMQNGGAYAEYASVPEAQLELKPESITFEEAAAVPTSGSIALKGVRDLGQVRPGHRVLVNGAGGGVGVFAVQLAKAYGAHVTAVDSTSKVDALRSIGADQVIDYTERDFTREGTHYDLMLDVPGNRSIADCRRALAPRGTYVFIGHERFGGLGARWIGRAMPRFIRLLLASPFGSQRMLPRAVKTNDSLFVLTSLIEAGQIAPLIDRTFPLSAVPAAVRYLAGGQAIGKVVVTVQSGDSR
jgi:NADPH:quinone reductase-like Zn-dependent oxidoreductase